MLTFIITIIVAVVASAPMAVQVAVSEPHQRLYSASANTVKGDGIDSSIPVVEENDEPEEAIVLAPETPIEETVAVEPVFVDPNYDLKMQYAKERDELIQKHKDFFSDLVKNCEVIHPAKAIVDMAWCLSGVYGSSDADYMDGNYEDNQVLNQHIGWAINEYNSKCAQIGGC